MRPPFYITERPADQSRALLRAAGIPSARAGSAGRRALPAHLAALRDRLRPAHSPGRLLAVRRCTGGCLPAAVACRWASCMRSAQRGWRRKPPHCPQPSLPSAGAHRPGKAGVLDRPVAATCIRLGCCLMASIPIGWCWCGRPKTSTRSPPWRSRCGKASPLRWWARWGHSTALPRAGCSLPACVTAPPASCCAAGHMATETADREANVAVTRWHLTPMPSAKDGKEPGLPRWHVALTHARGGRPGEWIMEASDDATHPLRVVAALADHAPEPQRAPSRRIGRWSPSRPSRGVRHLAAVGEAGEAQGLSSGPDADRCAGRLPGAGADRCRPGGR